MHDASSLTGRFRRPRARARPLAQSFLLLLFFKKKKRVDDDHSTGQMTNGPTDRLVYNRKIIVLPRLAHIYSYSVVRRTGKASRRLLTQEKKTPL
jgi:hypothetical protein